MSRIAQNMQRIADEIKAARKPAKGRRRTVDDLEDVTNDTGATTEPEQQPAAAAEAGTMAKAKTARKAKAQTDSAKRSKAWRDNKRQAATATAPPARTSIKAESGGGKIKGGRTVFLTVPLALAQRAFALLLSDVHANTEAPENAGVATDVQKLVNRLA